MTEQEIINIIRQYEYIPKDLLKKLLCRNDSKDEDYLERKLRYLVGIRCIEYLKESLNKSRLTAQHSSRLHLFRHLAPNSLENRQISCVHLIQSDCAI